MLKLMLMYDQGIVEIQKNEITEKFCFNHDYGSLKHQTTCAAHAHAFIRLQDDCHAYTNQNSLTGRGRQLKECHACTN